MSDVDSRQPPLTATSSGPAEFQFIVELPPRFATFAANLRAAWGRAPQEPGPRGDFWPDVLVARRFP